MGTIHAYVVELSPVRLTGKSICQYNVPSVIFWQKGWIFPECRKEQEREI